VVLLVISLFTICQVGCIGPGSSRKVVRRSELDDPEKTGKIQVLTRDGTLYELHDYALGDSVLRGRGWQREDTLRVPFAGSLQISDIEYVKAFRGDALKGLTATGLGIVLAGMAIAYLADPPEQLLVEPEIVEIQYWGGSCPFVYAFDGSHYRFESETFAGAFVRSMERSCSDLMQWLAPVNGEYVLKVSNERFETNYLNSISLQVVDVPSGLRIVPDSEGNLHTVAEPVHPFHCVNFDGDDLLSHVLEKDSLLWESDLDSRDLSSDAGLRDGLILQFEKPVGARKVKIVVEGANTGLGAFALKLLCNLRGWEVLRWYRDLETKPQEYDRVTEFMRREGTLHVGVMEDEGWVEQTSLPDVGPVNEKEQIEVLDLSGVKGNRVMVKLEFATGLWKINHVYLDYSEDAPLMTARARLSSAEDQYGKDILPLMANDDEKYWVALFGQSCFVRFLQVPEVKDMSRCYVLETKGYYHIWTEGKGECQADLVDRVLAEPFYGAKLYMPMWRSVRWNSH
jgi:hypothetical protein